MAARGVIESAGVPLGVEGARSLASSAFRTFLLRAAAFALALAVNVAISRLLGPEGRGEYALITLGAVTMATVGKLGLEHANVYLFGTARVPHGRLAEQNVVVSLSAGVVGGGLLVLAPVALSSVYGDVMVSRLFIAAIMIPFLLHTQLAAGLQNLRGEVMWQFRAALIGLIAQLSLVGVLGAIGALNVASALVAALAGTILTWLLLVSKDGREALRIHLDRAMLRQTTRYALIVHLGLMFFFLQTRSNQFLVKAFLGTTAVGYYGLAVLIAEALLLVADSLAIALLPRQAQGDLRSAAAVGLKGAAIGGALILAASIPVALAGGWLISLVFGSEFSASYQPLLALLPGSIFLGAQRFCGPPALRANRPELIAAVYAFGLAVNVGLNVLWIPVWGMVGAAAGTSVSYAATATLFILWTYRLSLRGRPA